MLSREKFSEGDRLLLVVVTLAMAVLLVACGGARNKGESQSVDGEGGVDVDKMLSTSEQAKQQSAEEAEVLRLLGITPEKSAADSAKEMVPSAAASGVSASEVERLQQEVQSRDQQIIALRSDLAKQESAIQELETQLHARQSAASPVRIRGVSEEFRRQYEESMVQYNQRNYREALAGFSRLLAMDDKNSLSDNAQYWLGECYYGLGNYNQAVAEFQKVLSFNRSNKSDAVLLKLGLCYVRLGDRNQARSELQQLIANFPNSQYVDKARTYLSRL